MPWVTVCPDGHAHLVVPCPKGCGQMHPTNIVIGEVPIPRSRLTFTNCSFENMGKAAVSTGADVLITGRNVRFRNCPTGFEVRGGHAQFDLNGIEYDNRPPRRERRKKKKR